LGKAPATDASGRELERRKDSASVTRRVGVAIDRSGRYLRKKKWGGGNICEAPVGNHDRTDYGDPRK